MQTVLGPGALLRPGEPGEGDGGPSGGGPGEVPPRHHPLVRRLTPDTLAAAATVLVVLGATLFVIWQLHPFALLFNGNMDDGGDNAGHVAAPYFLIHNLLPQGRVTGWYPGWLDGMPLYVFYFPLPALLVALFNTVMPYAEAFKLVTVAGSVLLPGAAYLCGRCARLRRPIPALMAVATVPFLFNTSYTIDGGNLASTLAGEFSFSLSIAFGLVFLGLVAGGLENGRRRGLAALMFALTVLCHVVPALFFAFGAVVLTVSYLDWRRIKFLAPVGIVGAMLAGFWLVPFALDNRYSSSLNYQRVSNIFSSMFPVSQLWLLVLAGVGCVLAIVLRDRFAIVLGVMTGASWLGFTFLPSGEIYNARWLPFWFLCAALLAAYALGELTRLILDLLEIDRWHELISSLLYAAAALVVVGVPLGIFQRVGTDVGLGRLGLNSGATSFVPGWISWNYTGFQSRQGWSSYQDILKLLGKAQKEYGCGRLEYEYTSAGTNWWGSTEGFMALPLYTNDCFQPTEGLYFESSTTTPFHFLDQTEFTSAPSQADVGLPYGTYNVADGVLHSQLMGVHYYLAESETSELAADNDPNLIYVGSAPGVPTANTVGNKTVTDATPFKLYYVKDAPLVAPLAYEPVVEAGMSAPAWLSLGIKWYQGEQYWPVPVTLGGPASWPHPKPGTVVAPRSAVAIDPTTVSHIVMTDHSISFDVARTGAPVVVKIPYFPNWQASGAEGPWEATPNLMVVVPTSHHVVLSYGYSHADIIGYTATGLGIILLIYLCYAPPPRYRQRRKRATLAGGASGAGSGYPWPDGGYPSPEGVAPRAGADGHGRAMASSPAPTSEPMLLPPPPEGAVTETDPPPGDAED